MARYYYPDANDVLSAKIQFLKEHHYKINHCFKNTWGKGYVLFDTKAEVNEWYKDKETRRTERDGNYSWNIKII